MLLDPGLLAPFFFLMDSRYMSRRAGKGRPHTHSHVHQTPHMDTLSHTLPHVCGAHAYILRHDTESLSHT